MKKILCIALFLTGCGGNGAAPTPTPTTTPTPTASATPSPTPSAETFVGNWVDAHSNTLSIESDGTAKSNSQALTWSLADSNIVFSSQAVEVDSCAWQVLATGGLNSTLTVTLYLACVKAGQLTFTRAP